MKIWKTADIEKRELVAGAQVCFVHGENMTLAYWEFDPGAMVPEHSHEHEQVTNVVEGVFELSVDGDSARLEAGSVVVIPSGASHSGRSITRCRLIDAFHPVREDYR